MRQLSVEIDAKSGFCFGVIHAIQIAESLLKSEGTLHSLGDIVHNGEEVKRLAQLGLHSVSHERLDEVHEGKVLFRAHGEAPQVYDEVRSRGLEIVDATCPVVLRLQRKIRETYEATRAEEGQIVLFGKADHAEVKGLVGQTNGEAIVLQEGAQVQQLVRPDRPVYLFSQTTMSRAGFEALRVAISEWLVPNTTFQVFDTICRQVSNRVSDITAFAQSKDWIYFIAGRHSSNGKWLYETARQANPHSYFISSPSEIVDPLPSWVERVGICGATSTPVWQMEAVAERVRELNGGVEQRSDSKCK